MTMIIVTIMISKIIVIIIIKYDDIIPSVFHHNSFTILQ